MPSPCATHRRADRRDHLPRAHRAGAGDRTRSDRGRHRGGRPRVDPRLDARPVDAVRPRCAVRRRRRRTDLPHQLAVGMPACPHRLGRATGVLRGRGTGREDRRDPRAMSPTSSMSSSSTTAAPDAMTLAELRRRGGRRGPAWRSTSASPQRPATIWRRSSTRPVRPARRRVACSRTRNFLAATADVPRPAAAR